MIVAIDCTTLKGRLSGVGYYTARLVDEIVRQIAENSTNSRVVLLSNRVIDRVVPQGASVYTGFRFPLRSVWMQFLLPLVLRRVRPNLTHFTNYLAPAWMSEPYVVSVHDMSLTRVPEHHTLRKRFLTATLAPRVAERARLVLAPSHATRRDIIEDLQIPEGRVWMVPYAAGEEFKPTTERPQSLPRSVTSYVLYVGTIEPRKNLVRALDAFALVARQYPDVSFVLAGQRGWKCEEIYSRAASSDLRDRVVILDYVSESDLPRLYSHATACFYPSLFEGFGFPVLEAMACGTPVITSDTTSLAEIGEDAALLVDPLNVAAMASAVSKVLQDSGLRADLRARGFARAGSYSWVHTAKETLRAYEAAAGITHVRSESGGGHFRPGAARDGQEGH